jgi:uncharacterized membrane protein
MVTPTCPNTGGKYQAKMNRLKEIAGNHRCQLVFFSLAHVIILPLLFYTVYKTPYSSLGIYFDYASRVMCGNIPYQDFIMEYPPFAMFFFILPRLFNTSFDVYTVIFQAGIFLFDLLGLFLIYRIAQRTGKAPWKMLTVYTIAILAIGPIIFKQYDIFPAIMVLLSLYCFWIGQHKTSWVILALATMTKIYPVVIAPIFLLYYVRNHHYQRIWQGILVFIATSMVVVLPFIAADPGGLLSFMDYHTERGMQLESTYSSFTLIAGKLGWISTQLGFSAGSWNITGPLADTLSTLSTVTLLFFLLMSYWFIYSRIQPGNSRILDLGTYSLLAIAVFLISNKVLSPQYLIWLIPLIPLMCGMRYTIWVVFAVIGALTYYIFPLHYVELIYLETWPIAILLVRNILLILLTVLVGVSLYRSRNSHPAP